MAAKQINISDFLAARGRGGDPSSAPAAASARRVPRPPAGLLNIIPGSVGGAPKAVQRPQLNLPSLAGGLPGARMGRIVPSAPTGLNLPPLRVQPLSVRRQVPKRPTMEPLPLLRGGRLEPRASREARRVPSLPEELKAGLPPLGSAFAEPGERARKAKISGEEVLALFEEVGGVYRLKKELAPVAAAEQEEQFEEKEGEDQQPELPIGAPGSEQQARNKRVGEELLAKQPLTVEQLTGRAPQVQPAVGFIGQIKAKTVAVSKVGGVLVAHGAGHMAGAVFGLEGGQARMMGQFVTTMVTTSASSVGAIYEKGFKRDVFKDIGKTYVINVVGAIGGELAAEAGGGGGFVADVSRQLASQGITSITAQIVKKGDTTKTAQAIPGSTERFQKVAPTKRDKAQSMMKNLASNTTVKLVGGVAGQMMVSLATGQPLDVKSIVQNKSLAILKSGAVNLLGSSGALQTGTKKLQSLARTGVAKLSSSGGIAQSVLAKQNFAYSLGGILNNVTDVVISVGVTSITAAVVEDPNAALQYANDSAESMLASARARFNGNMMDPKNAGNVGSAIQDTIPDIVKDAEQIAREAADLKQKERVANRKKRAEFEAKARPAAERRRAEKLAKRLAERAEEERLVEEAKRKQEAARARAAKQKLGEEERREATTRAEIARQEEEKRNAEEAGRVAAEKIRLAKIAAEAAEAARLAKIAAEKQRQAEQRERERQAGIKKFEEMEAKLKEERRAGWRGVAPVNEALEEAVETYKLEGVDFGVMDTVAKQAQVIERIRKFAATEYGKEAKALKFEEAQQYDRWRVGALTAATAYYNPKAALALGTSQLLNVASYAAVGLGEDSTIGAGINKAQAFVQEHGTRGASIAALDLANHAADFVSGYVTEDGRAVNLGKTSTDRAAVLLNMAEWSYGSNNFVSGALWAGVGYVQAST